MRLVIFFLALFPALNANAKLISAKLSRVKKEILETRLQISHYESLEDSLRRDAASLKHQNIRSHREMSRLKRLALAARDRDRKLSSQLAALEQNSTLWSSSLKGNFRAYWSMLKADGISETTDSLWKEEFLRFCIFNQTSMMRALGGSALKTAADKERTHIMSSHLIAESRQARVQSEQSLNAYEEKRSLLKTANRNKLKAQKRESRLEESAQALTKLLRRLSRASQRRKKTRLPQAPATVSIRPHSLPWPTQGVVSSSFGRQKNLELGTWVIHQGIIIATPSKVPVESVAAGRVIFSGPFRSYGHIVILDHGKKFFSIYGNLGAILKKAGETVSQGEILGLNAPNSTQPGNSLYFELRQGTQALNPIQWLNLQRKPQGY